MTKPNLGYFHTRIDGRLRAVHADGRITPPIIAGGDEGEENATFTPPESQEALNAIVENRLARERQKYADYDDLKEKATKFDAIEAENATDLDKANGRVTTLEAENADLKSKVATHEAAERTRKARSQIAAAAKDLAEDPGIVADLVLAKNAVTIDDAGQVTGAEAAVKQLIEQSPSLAKTTGAKPSFGAGAGSSGGTQTNDSTTPSGSVESGRERYEASRSKKRKES